MSYQEKRFYLGEWLVDPLTNSISNENYNKEVIPKLMETLCFFADNHEQVLSSELIVKAVWKKSVVGENSLYNNIAQLRKLLEDTTPKKQYIETIPKKGYRLIAPLREHQDSIPVRETVVRYVPENLNIESISANKNNHNFLIFAVTTLSLSLVAILYFWSSNSNEEDVTASMSTIAVLPFDYLKENEDTAYFSQGISDSMAHRLSQVPGLKVVSKSTSSVLKIKNTSFDELNQQLGIGTVLTGSLLKSEQNIRVIVQLIHTEDSSILWSNTFEKKLDDIFKIQDDIIQSTANSLKLKLSTSNRPLDVSIQAFDHYLKGRFFWNKRNSEDTNRAIVFFRKAIKLSPNYAQAYVGLSDAYIFQYEYGEWTREEAYSKAEYNIKRALEINENLAEAYTTQGLISMNRGYFDEAEKQFKKAISINPNYSTAYHWYGLLLNNIGQHEKALKLQRHTLSLDPLSAIVHRNVAFTYMLMGDKENATNHFERSLELGPDFFGEEFLRLNIYPLNLNSAEKAIRFASKYYDTIPETVPHKITLALLSLTANSPKKASIFIKQAEQLIPDHPRIIDAKIAFYGYYEDWEKVINLLHQKLVKQPLNNTTKFELAYAYFFFEQFEKLEKHLEKHSTSFRDDWRMQLLSNINSRFRVSTKFETKNSVTDDRAYEIAKLISENKLNEADLKLRHMINQGYVDDFSQQWWTLDKDPLFSPLLENDALNNSKDSFNQTQVTLKELMNEVPTTSLIIKPTH